MRPSSSAAPRDIFLKVRNLSYTCNISRLRVIAASIVWGVCCILGSTTMVTAEENASNPLAAVNNTDVRYKYKDSPGSDLQDISVEGSYMARPDLKLKYELHYNSTDVTGTRQSDFESASLKAIYFPSQTRLNETWGMKTAVGLEWIVDLGDTSKGIGSGSDILAPLFGVAFANAKSGLSIIPLVQHYESYNGSDFSQTAMRLIALQSFVQDYWAKLDLKVPYDWENETWPASAELQLGYNIRPGLSTYIDLMVGLGNDRSFDHGLGVGLRFIY